MQAALGIGTYLLLNLFLGSLLFRSTETGRLPPVLGQLQVFKSEFNFGIKLCILFFQDATNNTFLQPQNNSKVHNEENAEENVRKMNDGDEYSGKSCLEASSMTVEDVPQTGKMLYSDQVYTWLFVLQYYLNWLVPGITMLYWKITAIIILGCWQFRFFWSKVVFKH